MNDKDVTHVSNVACFALVIVIFSFQSSYLTLLILISNFTFSAWWVKKFTSTCISKRQNEKYIDVTTLFRICIDIVFILIGICILILSNQSCLAKRLVVLCSVSHPLDIFDASVQGSPPLYPGDG